MADNRDSAPRPIKAPLDQFFDDAVAGLNKPPGEDEPKTLDDVLNQVLDLGAERSDDG